MKRTLSQAKEYPQFVAKQLREQGLAGFKTSVATPFFVLSENISQAIDSRIQVGTPIWDADWDVLIILDACRVDLMRSVCDEYQFLPAPRDLEATWSIASMSKDWIERTFSSDYQNKVSSTGYVTGNCFTTKSTMECEPLVLDEVWKYAWDDHLSTIPARPITDRALDTWQSRRPNLDRMIIHYMQPHVPFVTDPDIGDYGGPGDFGEGFADIWHRIGDELDREVVWEAYVRNLRYVLDDVALLLDNLDAGSVVITADHGNAIGEWGLAGHPPGSLHPSIRCVPWIETTASSIGSYKPETNRVDPDAQPDVADRLSALGYT
ncbi:hypothetical protein V9T20_01775 [Halobacterium salinarum]|uniref:hypothetical protein n=1 Tax=Halobacterium salinarum TaxID=2242 RepID=UPI0030CC8CE1